MAKGSTSSDLEVLLLLKQRHICDEDFWANRNGWNANVTDLNSWSGVTAAANGCVTKLDLSADFDPFVSRFSEHLVVDVTRLHNLEENLKDNRLSGPFPVEVTRLHNLEELNLNNSRLLGNIPAELATMSNLQTLNLGDNKLTGNIPAELATMSNLQKLYLWSNKLTGNIPAELATMSNLQKLYLWSNKLTGDIPAELATMSNLQSLSLGVNKLTGNIPAELGTMSNLQMLNLGRNKLTGNIPAELATMSNLQMLNLEGNKLTGNIPAELATMSNLQTLDLGRNKLTGNIPPELATMSNLQTLNLWDNKLTGFGEVDDALKLTNRFQAIPHVYLEDNPWRMPPEAVVEQGLEAVKTYLKDVQDAKDSGASTRSLRQLKVVLVGSSGAGKTSLINSIVKDCAACTEGNPEDVSTVGIELKTHDLGSMKVEFYDCAGQLDYAGMHQTFLSKRALYLLVWDVKTSQLISADNGIDQIIRVKIMPWLTMLHLRAPEATVMLVANKCDDVIDKYSEITDRVEQRTQILLDEWQHLRGLGDRDGYVTKLSWLPGQNLVSCQDYTGFSELVKRISDFGSTTIEVPPSWDLALTVVNALRDDRAPLVAASELLELSETPPDTARKGQWTHTYVTSQELSYEWQRVVGWVKRKLEERVQEDEASNSKSTFLSRPKRALKGALWISEFAGNILRFDGGKGIFLDVVWLSQVLSPILSHKLSSECCPPSAELCTSKADLLNKGILRVDFARYLWRDVKNMNDRMLTGFYRVLLKLGVILPLGCTTLLGIGGRNPRVPFENEDTPQDMLVVMRLPDTCENVSEERLKASHAAVALDGTREVTLKWKFDSAGAPYGLIERLIASCYRIGEVVEKELCWRFGAFFKSHEIVQNNEQYVRLFTFMVRYDIVDAPRQSNSPERVLSLRVNGPLEDERVWVAIRYVASAVVLLSEEWPGVLWEGWSQCPVHRTGVMFLEPPRKAKLGEPLLPPSSAGPRSGCDCSLGENTIQGLVHRRLGDVFDTNKGVPAPGPTSAQSVSGGVPSPGPSSAQGTPSNRASLPRSSPTSGVPAPGPSSAQCVSGGVPAPGPSSAQSMSGGVPSPGPSPAQGTPSNRALSLCRRAIRFWRRNAWGYAAYFGGVASTIFLVVTFVGIVEGIDSVWIISLPFVVVLALGAIVSSAVACWDSIQDDNGSGLPTTSP